MRKKSKSPSARAQIARLSRSNYELEVRYTGGLDKKLDLEIVRVVGRKPSGSGMLLHLALRDITFNFENRQTAALRAAEKLKQQLPGVRVFLRFFEEHR